MANPGYVRSTDGNDADNGSTWALANATLAGAAADAAAGDTIYVSDNHAESQASAMTVTMPGTVSSPNSIVCGDDAAEPPTAVATTGTVTTTGASAITLNGSFYCYGLTFTAGTGASSAPIHLAIASADAHQVYDECVFASNTTGAAGHINVTADANGVSQFVEWRNVDISFGNASDRLRVAGGTLHWHGGALLAGVALPTTLVSMTQANGRGGTLIISGVDLSQLGSGKNLVDLATLDGSARVVFENCKLGASVSITTGSFNGPGPEVELINCDSADTNYRYCKKVYQGEITHESTIVRTGGASDGTTSISRKMVSSANSKFYSPLVLEVDEFWNETTGSTVTVTVEVVTDNVTLTDAEAWVEVEYLGTSGFPVSSFTSDRASNILSTPANQTTSTETWTTTGLTTPVKQKFSVDVTPQEKGPIKVRVMLAKASTTMYVCPKVKSDSARQYQAGPGLYLNEGTGGGGGIIAHRGMVGGMTG